MKTADNEQQWKKKYYNSLDELESKEKEWQELENLLRSVTIRMSLAIEGLDKSMDSNLDSLRSTLRKKPGKSELVHVIKGITNALDDLDKLKQQTDHDEGEKVLRHGWQVMLQLLRDVSFPSSFHTRCQQLESELMRCNEGSEIGNQIAEFRMILIDISEEFTQLALSENHTDTVDPARQSKNAVTEEKKKGFFGKLFNKERSEPTQQGTAHLKEVESLDSDVKEELSKRLPQNNIPVDLDVIVMQSENEPATSKSKSTPEGSGAASGIISETRIEKKSTTNNQNSCQSGVDVINLLASRLSLSGNPGQQLQSIAKRADNITNGQMLLELAADLANSLNRLWPSADNETVSHDVNVNEILLQLLDRLSLPPDLQQNVVLLQTKLEDVVRDEEWPAVLDQIAALIGEVRKKVQAEKKDLEKFLSHLTKRLQAIDNSLQGVKEDQKLSYSHSVQLNSLVTEQMLEIRSSVQDASDLNQLKLVVDARLDAITDHMERFRIKEQQRDQKARDRVGELTERLAVMEKETIELRGKVIKQRNLAMRDRLTGLPNRSAYDERLDQEYRRWRRFKENLCMVMIDVDHFKNINDNFGHKAGDKVLATIAAVIRDRIRETDFVARYGGEEFVALVTGAKLADAFKIADKLRAAVESCGFHFRGARVPVTISAGIAEFYENDTPDDVFERADKAMYEAKNNGRNCCRASKPE